jgi:hypothetical protein
MEKIQEISKIEHTADVEYYIKRLKGLFFGDRTDIYFEEIPIIGMLKKL